MFERQLVPETMLDTSLIDVLSSPADCGDVSIVAIIPLYNGAVYIEAAIRSVLAQTRPPNEVIVVDDGSTDSGPMLVEKLSCLHPVTLMRKQNGGQSAARNYGVSHSRSTLIALLDQDDEWFPEHLEKLVEPFQTTSYPELGWVYSDLDEVDENGALVQRNLLATFSARHPKVDVFACLRQDMFVLPSASLISRRAFEAVGGFDERLCGYEDDDLFLRLFRSGYRNVYLPQALSRWRIHLGSTSYSPLMARSRALYARKLMQVFPDDLGRNRHYVRDLIVPRFFPHMLSELRTALRLGDTALIDQALDDLGALMASCGSRTRLKFKLLHTALRTRIGMCLARNYLCRNDH